MKRYLNYRSIKVLITCITILNCSLTIAQTWPTLQYPGFENYGCRDWYDNNNGDDAITCPSYNGGCKDYNGTYSAFDFTWSASHGTPSVSSSLPHGGSFSAFLGTGTFNDPNCSEGLFQQYGFSSNASYQISFWVKIHSGESWDIDAFYVKLTNGLTPLTGPCDAGNFTGGDSYYYVPTPSSSYTLYSGSVTTDNYNYTWQQVTINIDVGQLDQNYDQIWFYPAPQYHYTHMQLDDITITPNYCCPSTIYYQNTSTEPPTTSVTNYITAGQAVTSGTQGWVTIESIFNSVVLDAENYIDLEPGVTADATNGSGLVFTAEIKACTGQNTSLVAEGVYYDEFNYTLTAIAYGGTPPYSYQWYDYSNTPPTPISGATSSVLPCNGPCGDWGYTVTDQCYNSSSTDIVSRLAFTNHGSSSSTTSTSSSFNWSIYPNPTIGIVNISLNYDTATDVSVSVYNTLGNAILIQPLPRVSKEIVPLDLSTQPSGIYMIGVNANDNVSFQKVVLAK